jgi:hypothetical protein
MSVALAIVCGQMHAHCNFSTCHPSYPQASPPDHPFLVLGLLALSPGFLVLLRLVTILVTILGISLCFSRVRRGRALRSRGFRLGDYDAISVTRSRSERHNTTILVGTTDAFGAGGELECQLLRTLARRILGPGTRVSTRISSTMDSVYSITVGEYLAIDKAVSVSRSTCVHLRRLDRP